MQNIKLHIGEAVIDLDLHCKKCVREYKKGNTRPSLFNDEELVKIAKEADEKKERRHLFPFSTS